MLKSRSINHGQLTVGYIPYHNHYTRMASCQCGFPSVELNYSWKKQSVEVKVCRVRENVIYKKAPNYNTNPQVGHLCFFFVFFRLLLVIALMLLLLLDTFSYTKLLLCFKWAFIYNRILSYLVVRHFQLTKLNKRNRGNV